MSEAEPQITAAAEGDTITVEVLKSDLPGLLTAHQDVGLDGEFLWPIPPRSLALLYRASPEHGRAIQVKAESAFGGGLLGETEGLEALCDTGTAELFTALGIDLEAYGNAFLQVIRSKRDKRPIGLRRLPAITISRFRAGFLQRVRLPNGEDKKITFTPEEIIHLKEPCPEGRRYALPTWIGAEGMLELAKAATRYNARFFSNSAMPEFAVIFRGGEVTKKQRADVNAFFKGEFQGVENSHRTLVLNCGEDQDIAFEKLTADVKDGDFLKLLDAARDRMPVSHGVPPRMLGIMSAGGLGGGGEVAGQLFTFELLTLKPKRRRMLDQLRPLLKELGLRPGSLEEGLGKGEVAFRALDLTPPKDDAEDLPGLVSSGIITEAEARAILPFLQGSSQSATGGSEHSISKSAGNPQLNVLAALLARL